MAIKVEVFSSSGCARCARAVEALRSLAEELGAERIELRSINVLEGIDRLRREAGRAATPAIDGKLAFTGLPSLQRLRDALAQRLREACGQ